MFYKIAKTLSVTASIIGIMMMAGACSVKSQELFYLYAALGITTLTTGAFALEYFRIREWQYRKRKIREAKEIPNQKIIYRLNRIRKIREAKEPAGGEAA